MSLDLNQMILDQYDYGRLSLTSCWRGLVLRCVVVSAVPIPVRIHQPNMLLGSYSDHYLSLVLYCPVALEYSRLDPTSN